LAPLLALPLLALLGLAGCASLPAAGPTTAAFAEAVIPDEGAAAEAPPPFALIETTPAVAETLAARDPGPRLAGLADGPEHVGQRLAVGDLVQVSLFEPTGGGLFGPAVELGGGAAAQTLPPQTVSGAGAIRVPYAGDVRVAGLTAAEAAARIEAALEGQAIEPQAVVTIAGSPSQAVTVVGDAVAGGGRVPLTGSGERVLDVLASAGGLSAPAHEAVLRLTREGRSASIDLGALLARPEQNVPVRPRDVIAVERRPQYFSVLGAANDNAQIPFGQAELSLAEALGKARGLIDNRADAAGVFVIRREPRETLAELGEPGRAALAAFPGPAAPTVYRLDLSAPEALLTAQRFPMRHQDLVYVANSASTPVEKTFRIIALALSPLNTLIVFDSLSQ
jgi:polysaccharide export outer membrane protein